MRNSDIIEIKKSNAFSAWKNTDQKGKELLENLLGKDNLLNKVTMDMIKTFEDACFFENKAPWDVLPYKNPVDKDEIATNAFKKMLIITRVLNGPDWKPDYKNSKQQKWYIWLVYDDSVSAFVFDHAHDGYTHTNAGAGVRLSFEKRETAEYAGRQFIAILNEIVND